MFLHPSSRPRDNTELDPLIVWRGVHSNALVQFGGIRGVARHSFAVHPRVAQPNRRTFSSELRFAKSRRAPMAEFVVSHGVLSSRLRLLDGSIGPLASRTENLCERNV
ncbi:unnamed protein product, partial [Iphiclides podalirius]